MTALVSAAARRTLARYDRAPGGDRFHVRARWLTCPIAVLERRVPRAGRVLDVGCGHGLVSLYLADQAPERQVTGIDIDAHKIELAEQAAADPPTQARFVAVGPGELPDGPWDAVVITDVLYLLAPDAWAALLATCAEHLAPDGVLLVKETDTRPRWKYWLSSAQEVVSTRVLRITAGSHLEFTPAERLAASLEALGLTVTVERLDRGYLHPHVLLTARRRR